MCRYLEEVCLQSRYLSKQSVRQGLIRQSLTEWMDAVFGYAGADDTQWIAKIQNKIEKNEEVQKITEKVMDEMVNESFKRNGL